MSTPSAGKDIPAHPVRTLLASGTLLPSSLTIPHKRILRTKTKTNRIWALTMTRTTLTPTTTAYPNAPEEPYHVVTGNKCSTISSLIMSHHSASRLCEDERSFGPDFVSYAEGRFCDMHLKAHVPLCMPVRVALICYDVSMKAVVGPEGSVVKNYTHVVEW